MQLLAQRGIQIRGGIDVGVGRDHLLEDVAGATEGEELESHPGAARDEQGGHRDHQPAPLAEPGPAPAGLGHLAPGLGDSERRRQRIVGGKRGGRTGPPLFAIRAAHIRELEFGASDLRGLALRIGGARCARVLRFGLGWRRRGFGEVPGRIRVVWRFAVVIVLVHLRLLSPELYRCSRDALEGRDDHHWGQPTRTTAPEPGARGAERRAAGGAPVQPWSEPPAPGVRRPTRLRPSLWPIIAPAAPPNPPQAIAS